MDSINLRYVVIRTDAYGAKCLVRTALSHKEASDHLKTLLKQRTKALEQTYEILEYELGTRAAFLREHGILL